jgi:septal ring factor EnvC (AmiA/AmiB activator)
MTTEIALIEEITEENAPSVFVAGGLAPFVDRVRQEIGTEVPDLTSKKGRDRIASLAAKVARSKKAVENPGREYLQRLKAMPKIVEAELREFVRAMDYLRDEVRAPLNEWEQKEKDRVAGHQERVEQIKRLSSDLAACSAADIQVRIDAAEMIEIGASFEEFEGEAATALVITLKQLRGALVEQQKYEAQQAELARLKAEAEAKERAEREERIRLEAAEKARLQAEQHAKAEQEAAMRREVEAKMAAERAERSKQEAEDRAARAEAEAQAKADKAAKDAEERMRKEAEDRANREAAEAAAREADKAHRGSVNSAAANAFVEAGFSLEDARKIVSTIILGKVPNVRISY